MTNQLWTRGENGQRVLETYMTAEETAAEFAKVPSTDNIITIDQTFDAVFHVVGSDIHNNGELVEMADLKLDGSWSRELNVVSYIGSPFKVTGMVSVNAPDNGSSNYWSRPKMRIRNGSRTVAIIDDLVMQQNSAYDGDAVLNGVFYDHEPSENPSYTFEWFRKDNRVSTLPPNAESIIAITATHKVEVFSK